MGGALVIVQICNYRYFHIQSKLEIISYTHDKLFSLENLKTMECLSGEIS
jgi:hypothetical protein